MGHNVRNKLNHSDFPLAFYQSMCGKNDFRNYERQTRSVAYISNCAVMAFNYFLFFIINKIKVVEFIQENRSEVIFIDIKPDMHN